MVHGDEAVMRGMVDLLIFFEQKFLIVEFRTHDPFDLARDKAVKAGHLEMVHWIQDYYKTPPLSCRAMDYAAWTGNLEVCKWLHRICSQACSGDALKGACKYGHLEAVKFLYMNYASMFNEDAMDALQQAALGCHLEILGFFASKGFTVDLQSTLIRALVNQQTRVVAWLYQNCMAEEYDFFEEDAKVETETGLNIPLQEWLKGCGGKNKQLDLFSRAVLEREKGV